MEINLEQFVKDGERLVAASAIYTHSKKNFREIYESINDNTIKEVMKLLILRQETSPLEHVGFTYSIEPGGDDNCGITLIATHEWVRHRIGMAYTQKSGRILKRVVGRVVPKSVKNNPKALKIYKSDLAMQEKYEELLQMEGIPVQDARYIFAAETGLIVTFNLRSFLHFCEQRRCKKAADEIREAADRMRELIKDIYPTVYKYALPPCEKYKFCPKGEGSCKNICSQCIYNPKKNCPNEKIKKQRLKGKEVIVKKCKLFKKSKEGKWV